MLGYQAVHKDRIEQTNMTRIRLFELLQFNFTEMEIRKTGNGDSLKYENRKKER